MQHEAYSHMAICSNSHHLGRYKQCHLPCLLPDGKSGDKSSLFPHRYPTHLLIHITHQIQCSHIESVSGDYLLLSFAKLMSPSLSQDNTQVSLDISNVFLTALMIIAHTSERQEGRRLLEDPIWEVEVFLVARSGRGELWNVQFLQGRWMIVLCVLTGKTRGQGEKKEKSGFQASSLDCTK